MAKRIRCAQCAECVRAVCTVRACILRVLEEGFGFLNPSLKPFPISLHFKVVQGHLAGVVHGIISECLDTHTHCAPKPPITSTKHAQGTHNACMPHLCRVRAACTMCACSVHIAKRNAQGTSKSSTVSKRHNLSRERTNSEGVLSPRPRDFR